MCLILFSFNNHPTYQLILGANRDEFHQRPAIPANFWKDHPEVLGGIDTEAGGTWMGISKTGRIAMITNYRDLSNIKASAPSRGHLVADFLTGQQKASEYLSVLNPISKNYNGYNLLVGTPKQLYYQSNYGSSIASITPGIHGLSNALLNTPWHKVEKGKKALNQLIESSKINTNNLLDMMYDEELAIDKHLPNTGIGLEKERILSPMFIKSNGYGSRCSTAILITHEGKVEFSERTYQLTDFSYSEKHYQFQLQQE